MEDDQQPKRIEAQHEQVFVPVDDSDDEEQPPKSEQEIREEEEREQARQKARHQQLRVDAIATLEAQRPMIDFCESVLQTTPTFHFETYQKPAPFLSREGREYYVCRVTIRVGDAVAEQSRRQQLQCVEGTFTGSGLSKRMAKMAACRHAMEAWTNCKLVNVNGKPFDEYVREIADDVTGRQLMGTEIGGCFGR